MKKVFKTMAFTLLGLVLSSNLWAATKTLIVDGSKLTSTATTAATDYTYGDFTITMSDGAKQQASSGKNKFTGTENAILIGKSGKYIFNKTPFGKITKFELYANKGASAKVSVGVLFSTTAISEYATGDNTYTATLSTLDNVYDCSSKIPEGAKYFWYQVTNSNNSQVMFRITYEEEEEDPTEPSLSVDPKEIDFGTVEQNATIPAGQDVEVTFANLTTNDVTASISGDFNISKSANFTSGDKITVTPKSTATIGTIEGTLTVKATTDDITKTVPITMIVAAPEVGVSFEKATSAYTDWTFTNFASQQTHSDVKAHTGAYFGTTGGKESGSMVTKAKIAKPGTLQFFISKTTTNTTSSSWKVSVSTDNSSWTQVGEDISATSVTKGKWTEVNVDLTAYSNVYVKLEYTGSSAVRCIDDVVFIAPQSYDVTLATNPASVGTITAKVNNVEIGAQVEEGQTVTLSAAPNDAHAYRFKEWQSDDVTITDNAFEMPGKAVTITAVFEPVYAVSIETAGEGSGTATINGSTETIYVGENDEITLVAENATGSEFGGWSASDNDHIVFDDATAQTTTATVDAAVTITATFNKKECTILGTPQNVQVTDKTYFGAKMTWDAVKNADYYEVYITKGAEEIESNMVEETEYTISATLSANTEYSYSIIANSEDDDTYCASNPAEGIFTTADYPAVVLTLSENEVETPVNGKLNTPIELPTTSTQACDGKVFVGWSATEIDGEVDAEPSLLGETYTFTDPEQLTKTIYAVYAKEVEGSTSWNKVSAVADVAVGEYVIINNGYYLPNATATSGGPAKSDDTKAPSISNNQIADVNVTAAMKWILSDAGEGKFYVKNSGGNYLYANSSNSGLRVGNTSDTWAFEANDGALAMKETNNSRYCASYTDGSDWRSYTTANAGNYGDGGKLYLYKKTTASSSYSKYCTTCEAAVAVPTFSLDEGEYDEAKTLTLFAAEGDIYYTINDGEETKYTTAIALNNRGTYEISAYAKVDDRTSDVVTKTYTLDWPYESLEELVAANVPSGTTVTVSFSNVVINSFNGTKGVNLNVQCEGKNIQIYNSTAFDTQWKVGGTLSKSNLTCTWSRFVQNSEFRCWELMPTNWDGFTYNDPVHITSIAISGEPTNKDYSDGQQLNPAGLVVTGTYSDSPEHTEVITEGLTWTLPTLTEGATSAQVSVKYTEPVLSTPLTSEEYEVTINAVTPAKTLQSIRIADDSEHQTEFFVGRPFNSNGLKVLAKYSDNTEALVTPSVTPPTMTSEGTKQVTVSYTEGGVTADAITYDITLTYMDLNNLVTATDINDHDHVYVKFENVMITDFYSTKGIYLNVQKGDKDIEIYNPSTNYPNTWAKYGTVSATLDNVEWTYYTTGSVWELKISNWNAFTYNEPNIPVESMEISPAEVSVKETGTTTLSIVYNPTSATNKGVTWAVTAGSEYASVDEEGVVTGILAGTATITATLTADPTITATRTVTVTETAKCEISYYVKDEVASTQQIAREEEGSLTYVPTLEVAGYTFAGWAEDAIAEETATATLISTYTPGAEETAKSVYAVFKRVDDSSPTYQQYAKVTSALTDWAGDYLIAYSDEIFADGRIGGKEDEGAIGKQYVKVNPEGALSGNVVTKEWGDQYKVTLEEISAGSNTYVLKTQDGKYNYQTGNSNGLSASSTKSTAAQYPITVTFTSENDIKLALGGNAAGAVFRYNTDQFFRYYKDGGQQPVYLYKYDAGSVMYTSNPVAKVKVTFNLDGGVGGCGTITVNEGEDAVLCGDAPTKDLYKFDAWSDGENEYAPGATITHVTEDIELTALWIAKQQYTISFNKGGAAGTTPASIKDYEYNVVTLPAQGDLSNPGYIFGGWNDGETTYAGGASFTMPEKNVSMTAVWVAKTNDKWVLVTEAEQLTAGKQYAIVSNEKEAAMGAKPSDKDFMASVSASFNADKSMMIAIDPSAVILTLGGNATDGWTLSNNGQYLGSGTVKYMSWSTEVGDANKWEITIAGEDEDYEAKIHTEVGYLCYNAGSPRFNTYENVQSKVQLYVLVPAQVIDDEVNASTLDDHADVTVNEGGNLLIDAPKTLGDIYVMEGGKVTIQTEATLTVNNFVIKSTMGAGQSGQVIGITETNFKINGNAYFDVTLGDNGNPEKWHAFAVPFNVDAINGIYDLDDNKLTNEVNYAIMDYHGDVRATGAYGWKKFRGIMTPGTFYLMTVDGQRTTYRMKMKDGFQASSTTITVNQYASGTDTDAGWNGIANNQLGYSSLGVDVQVLNPTTYTYEVMTASTYNFTVGTPFFYQASATGTIDLTAPNASENYAPRRVGAAEAKNIAVTLGNDNYIDRLYISATDEATNEYQIGRDLVKMTMTNTPAVPQIFAEAYGTKLCMVDAPMMYDEAVYALNLYAPANGEYTIGAAQVDGYEVFLTQYGSVIWKLSMSEATIELTKGNNTEYGLILKAASGHAPTNINTINGQESVQKFLYNSNIYIRHNNKTFNVQGQLVK